MTTSRGFFTLSLTLSISALVASTGTSQTVHSHQKFSDLEGGFVGVLKDRDRFGGAVTVLGDLDGNGARELAVGAPGTDSGGLDSGAVWILFRNTDGSVASHLKIDEGKGGFSGQLDYTDAFGSAIACVGDVDGDGNDDLAVGIPSDDGPPFSCSGMVKNCNRGGYWILFMNADGSVKNQTVVDSGQNFGSALFVLDYMGCALAGVGDLDGDLIPDLVAGAPGMDHGGRDVGGLFVVFQDAAGRSKAELRITEGLGGFGGDLNEEAGFGSSVAAIGDLDGNGCVDLAVGAPEEGTGAVWILFLDPGGVVVDEQEIGSNTGGFAGILQELDRFGSSVIALGDVDGDMVEDIAVGAYTDDDGGSNRGATWIVFLNADGTVKAELKISDTEGGFAGGLDDADVFGFSGAAFGGVNADGSVDLLVGAPRDDDGGMDRGAFYELNLSVDVCGAASAQVLNGSGVNPLSLSNTTLAVLGQFLELELDCSGNTKGVAVLLGRGAADEGSFGHAGESLIDRHDRGALPFRLHQKHDGGTVDFSIAIPDDVSLCGQKLFIQGQCMGPPGAQLSNALEMTIGG